MDEPDPRYDDPEIRRGLHRSRPVPRDRFVSDLRRRLTDLERRTGRPPHLWGLVAACLAAGVLLLTLAALSANGGGPFS